MTDYVVLDMPSGAGWRVLAEVKARSAKAAIQSVVDDQLPEDQEGDYVAIPKRSWRPVEVKVETKTALKFS